MNTRTVATLGAIVAIVIAAAAWVGISQEAPATKSELLYPQAKAEIDQAKSLRVIGSGNDLKVELVRAGDDWRVVQRSNYPADTSKVRKLLIALSDAKVVEEKTSNPQNYAALGVEDLTNAAAAGSRVEVVGTKTPLNLIVGKAGPGANARYVRRAGEKPSWLINADLDAPADPKEWLDHQLLDISADRIQSASIEPGGKQAYVAAKKTRADANFGVTGLKKGQSLSTDAAANAFATALASLTLDDVRPEADFGSRTPAARATYKTFDGVVLELNGWTENEKRWIQVTATHDPALAQQFGVAPKADDKAAEAKSEGSAKQPDREKEVAEINTRTKGWVYEIADYKYDAIFRPLEELLK